jgi:cystathionine beta-lyase
LIDYLSRNRDCLETTIAGIKGISMSHVEATYLAWIDCRELGLENPAAFFEDHGVGLSDGGDFCGRGFVRLNFGCPRSTLESALERIGNAVSILHQR